MCLVPVLSIDCAGEKSKGFSACNTKAHFEPFKKKYIQYLFQLKGFCLSKARSLFPPSATSLILANPYPTLIKGTFVKKRRWQCLGYDPPLFYHVKHIDW